MDQLFAELKEKYEFVIIDSPPIGLVTDSYDLMRYARLYIVCNTLQLLGEKLYQCNFE